MPVTAVAYRLDGSTDALQNGEGPLVALCQSQTNQRRLHVTFTFASGILEGVLLSWAVYWRQNIPSPQDEWKKCGVAVVF